MFAFSAALCGKPCAQRVPAAIVRMKSTHDSPTHTISRRRLQTPRPNLFTPIPQKWIPLSKDLNLIRIRLRLINRRWVFIRRADVCVRILRQVCTLKRIRTVRLNGLRRRGHRL
jgi:hypothetical protein